MIAFIDAHRDGYGVESICAQLPIAPSTYYAHKVREIDPTRVPPRLPTHAQLLDALEQALWSRAKVTGVVHHSDHGSQIPVDSLHRAARRSRR